ncbi:unnamed protein product [Aureobasidium mustum]|uniref:Cell wall protein n=1 Tax=Aureobasidium mustum TaxID=2773714 RepID=A0A9N8PP54_9PEZI|nr:unnamed protein product [Aureobasidium mustum]
MHLSHSIPIVLFSALVHARTDLTGCTRTDVSSPAGASYAWIVPETGELCDPLDCGGGRAPPKTTVPGCALYVGTETYKPSFLAGFSASMTAGGMGSVEASALTTAAPTLTASASAAAAATATATAATDDDADADDGDADDDEDIYDLSDMYPTGWNDMTPQQKSSWVSSYWTVDPTEPITAMASATSTGASTSAQQFTTTSSVISASSAASSPSNSTILSATPATSITTSTRDLPTLAPASTTSTMTTTSLSMSRSWVKTIPTFAKGAADVEIDRASVSSSGSAAKSSASASLVDSTGAAEKVGCAIGAAGVVAAVAGALAVL